VPDDVGSVACDVVLLGDVAHQPGARSILGVRVPWAGIVGEAFVLNTDGERIPRASVKSAVILQHHLGGLPVAGTHHVVGTDDRSWVLEPANCAVVVSILDVDNNFGDRPRTAPNRVIVWVRRDELICLGPFWCLSVCSLPSNDASKDKPFATVHTIIIV